MSIAFIHPRGDADRWAAAFRAADPGVKVQFWPRISDPASVRFAVCWNQPAGALRRFPGLRAISSLGAGVEHLLSDPTLPEGVPLVRLVDDDLKRSMAEYVVLGVLEHFRRFGEYRRLQELRRWDRLTISRASELGVGVMGIGEMGRFAADRLRDLGFTVSGWARSPKPEVPFPVYAGRGELNRFLGKADVLVCLLPLTPETENILDARTFRLMPQGAFLINAARGGHLVEKDLLAALDAGHLSGALLDVFREEPLPDDHPFWRHQKVTLTPHIASVTNPASAAERIVENYRRAVEGRPLLHLVDVGRGY